MKDIFLNRCIMLTVVLDSTSGDSTFAQAYILLDLNFDSSDCFSMALVVLYFLKTRFSFVFLSWYHFLQKCHSFKIQIHSKEFTLSGSKSYRTVASDCGSFCKSNAPHSLWERGVLCRHKF